MSLEQRAYNLLKESRFVTLASCSKEGDVWASTVNYIPVLKPVSLVWSSQRSAQHSQNIRNSKKISGSIFRYDLQGISPLGVDGVQFNGSACEISSSESEEIYNYFRRCNFSNESESLRFMPPLEEFLEAGHRRFYRVKIQQLWLFDIDEWLDSKNDQRVLIDIDAMAGLRGF
ncbi:hypothetical protein CT157_11340 [Pseudomonas syringae]|uniref:Pyridoxamine 5'-phosphate oxidase N-terminal domain-containing protein n=1 Tax=Pseudomonas syringae TaxID=317 RepID=A0A3T0JT01_PSESX|nr:hypothetical protein CT157_11340 [Pseudomonas syringae]